MRDNTRMPSLTTQASITFLYYNDLPSACAFYESALGLALVVDQGGCKIYAITPQSWVGLVDAEHGTHKPATDKPVILSFVTDDVDAWHAHLTKLGAPMFRPLGTSQAIDARRALPMALAQAAILESAKTGQPVAL